MNENTVKIEAPNLIEFVFEIEKRVREGYSVDDTNEGLPQSWGPGLYTCTLTKSEPSSAKASEPVEQSSTSDSAETTDEPKKTTTRKTRKSSK